MVLPGSQDWATHTPNSQTLSPGQTADRLQPVLVASHTWICLGSSGLHLDSPRSQMIGRQSPSPTQASVSEQGSFSQCPAAEQTSLMPSMPQRVSPGVHSMTMSESAPSPSASRPSVLTSIPSPVPSVSTKTSWSPILPAPHPVAAKIAINRVILETFSLSMVLSLYLKI
jgi:hypothetical protein